MSKWTYNPIQIEGKISDIKINGESVVGHASVLLLECPYLCRAGINSSCGDSEGAHLCQPYSNSCRLIHLMNDAQEELDRYKVKRSYAGFPTYQDYLQSEYWQKVRTEALEHYHNKCMLCSKDSGLNVHHNNYTNLGNETMADVVVLCRDCHSKHHEKGD